MKKIVLTIMCLSLLIACKDEKKEVEIVQEIVKEVVKKEKKPELKLSNGVVQLNKKEFVTEDIILTKVQVQDTKADNFVFKVFFKTDEIETLKNGDYSLFIQNFPYEEDVKSLEAKYQKSGIVSYWVSLTSAKPYQDGYVVFKSFKSNIYDFEKTVVGVKNLKTKADLFRTQYEDSSIKK